LGEKPEWPPVFYLSYKIYCNYIMVKKSMHGLKKRNKKRHTRRKMGGANAADPATTLSNFINTIMGGTADLNANPHPAIRLTDLYLAAMEVMTPDQKEEMRPRYDDAFNRLVYE